MAQRTESGCRDSDAPGPMPPFASDDMPRRSHVRAAIRADCNEILGQTRGGSLERIGALYDIEAMIRGRTADERRAVRQEHSRTKVEAFTHRDLHTSYGCWSMNSKLSRSRLYSLKLHASSRVWYSPSRMTWVPRAGPDTS